MSDWPECGKCGNSILVHRLVGHLAYCVPDVRSSEYRSTFTVTQINAVRRTLGHSISNSSMDRERREKK
jgi:hypothetical protein